MSANGVHSVPLAFVCVWGFWSCVFFVFFVFLLLFFCLFFFFFNF